MAESFRYCNQKYEKNEALKKYLHKINESEKEMERVGFALLKKIDDMNHRTELMSIKLEKLKILKDQYFHIARNQFLNSNTGYNSAHFNRRLHHFHPETITQGVPYQRGNRSLFSNDVTDFNNACNMNFAEQTATHEFLDSVPLNDRNMDLSYMKLSDLSSRPLFNEISTQTENINLPSQHELVASNYKNTPMPYHSETSNNHVSESQNNGNSVQSNYYSNQSKNINEITKNQNVVFPNENDIYNKRILNEQNHKNMNPLQNVGNLAAVSEILPLPNFENDSHQRVITNSVKSLHTQEMNPVAFDVQNSKNISSNYATKSAFQNTGNSGKNSRISSEKNDFLKKSHSVSFGHVEVQKHEEETEHTTLQLSEGECIISSSSGNEQGSALSQIESVDDDNLCIESYSIECNEKGAIYSKNQDSLPEGLETNFVDAASKGKRNSHAELQSVVNEPNACKSKTVEREKAVSLIPETSVKNPSDKVSKVNLNNSKEYQNNNNRAVCPDTVMEAERKGSEDKDLKSLSSIKNDLDIHHSESSIQTDSEDSFFDKDVPLTSTPAYQNLIGTLPIPKKTYVPSDSESEDEIENTLAKAVKEPASRPINDPLRKPSQGALTESKEAAKETGRRKSEISSIRKASIPSAKLSKVTKKALGLDSDSDVVLPVASIKKTNAENDSDEFDFYD